MTTTSDLVATDLGIGIGLRAKHFGEVLEQSPELGWFEILSENFLRTGGRPMWVLDQVAERYPIAMHGVSMNLGSIDPLNHDYLASLKRLQARCGARWISDHVCWTGVDGIDLHDLMPLPYTEDSLQHFVARVREAQDVLEQPLVVENPSTYIEFRHSTMTETEWLTELCAATDCGLLLDINNIYVCARNHDFDPYEYLRNVPWDSVVYHHVAGHTDCGTHLLDTHIGPTIEAVWDLYAEAHRHSGGRSTLYEWDDEIPPLTEVVTEARRAQAIRSRIDDEVGRG